MRIACLAVLDLPLQAILRAEPELRGAPLAVVAAPAERGAGRGAKRPASRSPSRTSDVSLTARVVATSGVAAVLGVRPGQTAAQARATAPSLILRAASAEQVAAARAALVDAALGFAPRVERDGDLAWLEVGDLGRLYPTERELALGLRAGAAALGLAAGVGIAGSKGVARIAARAASVDAGVQLVAAGEEARFVGPLPVAALLDSDGSAGGAKGEAKPDELLVALRRFGVTTCAALARLPVREVALRFGALGVRLHRLASGRCDEPLAPRAPPDELEEGVELDFAVVELEALAFVLRGLLDRLLGRLGARHLACAGVGLRLRLESGGHDVRDVPLAAPTREAAALLALIRLDVERRPPDAPIVGATLFARAACARPSQMDLFLPAGPAPERLATTVARLAALVGDGEGTAVGSPRAPDTHREEAIAVAPFAPPAPIIAATPREPKALEAAGARASLAALAFRRFRPERAVEVLLDGGAVPRMLSGDGLAGHVIVAAGPYRVGGEWWLPPSGGRPPDGGGFARDYWDVHAADGALYRIYCDVAGAWFVAGYYD